jgi:hypothetical protein
MRGLLSCAAVVASLIVQSTVQAADPANTATAAANRAGQPTAEQLAAIDSLEHVPPTSIDGRELLQRAMMQPANEALAERLVDLCLHDARRSLDFIEMIQGRAFRLDSKRGANGPMKLGIDGQYLKTAALATIDALEHPPKDPNHLRLFRSGYGVGLAIAYSKFHPDDLAARNRLLKLATQSARLPPPINWEAKPRRPLAQAGNEKSMATTSAWAVLLELGVLNPGMTANEAIAILGPPSGQSDERLNWYIATPRHVNPGLSAALKDGKVTQFQRYSG